MLTPRIWSFVCTIGYRHDVGAAAASSPPPADASPDALIIVAHLICSNIRHLRFPQVSSSAS